MNLYRIASYALVALFVVGLTSALFFPGIAVIAACTALFPFAMAVWVFAMLRRPEESQGSVSRGEQYEHF
ncbi:MAG: hypothetical protein OHK0039_49060 [Bacteroidia bacterium]